MLLYMWVDILQECVECTNAHIAMHRQSTQDYATTVRRIS
jgi:hypothetical protein